MGEGTVNDEELVEALYQAIDQYVSIDRYEAGLIAAALRSAGFQVFRPEDCKAIDVVDDSGSTAPGAYFLVPADSGGSG